MLLLSEPTIAEPVTCPYLPDRQFSQEYFFALQLTTQDFGHLLRNGWRRFGTFFFRPNCNGCSECKPIRVRVHDFKPTKSQRRVIKKNRDTRTGFNDLTYDQGLYDIYKEHSADRFDKDESPQHFQETFFNPYVVKASQSEYFQGDTRFALGFLDHGDDGVSSVYFTFTTPFSNLSPGTYSVIREIEWAKELGLSYYYLGYYIEENKSMRYKGRFEPYELMDWETGEWGAV